MVLLGVILVLLAAAAGVVLIAGTAQLTDSVQIDVLGGTLSLPAADPPHHRHGRHLGVLARLGAAARWPAPRQAPPGRGQGGRGRRRGQRRGRRGAEAPAGRVRRPRAGARPRSAACASRRRHGPPSSTDRLGPARATTDRRHGRRRRPEPATRPRLGPRAAATPARGTATARPDRRPDGALGTGQGSPVGAAAWHALTAAAPSTTGPARARAETMAGSQPQPGGQRRATDAVTSTEPSGPRRAPGEHRPVGRGDRRPDPAVDAATAVGGGTGRCQRGEVGRTAGPVDVTHRRRHDEHAGEHQDEARDGTDA